MNTLNKLLILEKMENYNTSDIFKELTSDDLEYLLNTQDIKQKKLKIKSSYDNQRELRLLKYMIKNRDFSVLNLTKKEQDLLSCILQKDVLFNLNDINMNTFRSLAEKNRSSYVSKFTIQILKNKELSKKDISKLIETGILYNRDIDFQPDPEKSKRVLNLNLFSFKKTSNKESEFLNNDEFYMLLNKIHYKKYISYINIRESFNFSNMEEKLKIIDNFSKIIGHSKTSFIIEILCDLDFNMNHFYDLQNITTLSKAYGNKFEALQLFLKKENTLILEKAIDKDDRDIKNRLYALYIYCLNNKKKAFLNLINNDGLEDMLEILRICPVFFSHDFLNTLNLNTLNKSNLKEILKNKNEFYKSKPFPYDFFDNLTFNEFVVLRKSKKEYLPFLYSKMTGKIDNKLKTIKEFDKINFLTNSNLDLDLLSEKLSENPLSVWMKEFSHIENLTKSLCIEVLANYNYFKKFIVDLKADYDVEFLLRNKDNIDFDGLNFNEIIQVFFNLDESCVNLFNELKLPNSFIQDNYERINNFCLGNSIVYASKYLNSKKLNKQQQENFYKIIKAEMSGKLSMIKYIEGDLEKELGLDYLDNPVKKSWIEKISLKSNNFSISDYDDFKSILTLGVYPETTCMSYMGGAYSQCLLSNFDSNKKVVYVKDETENIIGRAIIRFTKINKFCNSQNNLNFVDVSNGLDIIKNKKQKSDSLVVFLEKAYINNVKGNKRELIEESLIRLAKNKAKKMGVSLFVSDYYLNSVVQNLMSDNDKELNKENSNYYVYISYSKNGEQYLDSLCGNTRSNKEGSMSPAIGNVIKEL